MADANGTETRQQPRGWKRMFLDDEGHPSSMRVMAAIAFLASLGFAPASHPAVTSDACGTANWLAH